MAETVAEKGVDPTHSVRGALRLIRAFGIGVYIHWTFWLLIIFLVVTRNIGGLAIGETLYALSLVAGVFACVVLHEFGHALMGRRFGVVTKDIVLLPIGGMARMVNLPRKPWHEFLIAIAGPLVNVVIALAILGVLVSLNIAIPDGMSYSRGYLPNLFLVNVILVLFNLIPAFPMDGGRVLRSLLSMKIGFLRATELAARIGQAISVAFFVFGLFAGHVIMVLIAVFVFLAGGAEARAARFAPPGAGGWGGGRPDPDDADSGLPDHPEREQWGG